jgi:hypothetical protein
MPRSTPEYLRHMQDEARSPHSRVGCCPPDSVLHRNKNGSDL